MENKRLRARLRGIRRQLLAVHGGGRRMSSASKGREREDFIDDFLGRVLPPQFRFGSGDVVDSFGHSSGQLDLVVEYPFAPSLPLVAGETRLYLAEGVASAIEVKSDLKDQWPEVVRTARKLRTLERRFESVGYGGDSLPAPPPTPWVPLFAVGYDGWKNASTAREHLMIAKEGPPLDGILVLKHGIYVDRTFTFEGDMSLWGLVAGLQSATIGIAHATVNLLDYGM